MTRVNLKDQIMTIIRHIEPVCLNEESAYILWTDAENAAEEIMKLWDQGFTYDLKTDPDSHHESNITRNS